MTKASDNVFPRFLISEGGSTSTPASGQVTMYAKADGLLYSKDDAGTESAVSGGGGITQAYAGYNTVGGSTLNMTAGRVYAIKVTLANACLLTSIEAHVDGGQTNDTVDGFGVALYADAAGTPSTLIAVGGLPGPSVLLDSNASGAGNTTGRWLGHAIGKWLTAADYWLAVTNFDQATTAGLRIYYDSGSGTSRHYTSGGDWLADWGFYAATTVGDRLSIRANTIR